MISSQLLPRVSSDWIKRSARLLRLLLLSLVLVVLSSPALAQEEPAVQVSVPDTSAAPGDTVAVPIQVGNLDQAESVVSYAFNLSFDTTDVSYVGYEEENTLTGEAGGFFIQENKETPRIVAAGTNSLNDLADSGELIQVLLIPEDEGATTVTLTSLEFNEGSPPAEPAEPQFTFAGATNSAPEVGFPLPDETLKIPGPPLEFTNLGQSVFTDPDGDALSISASSGNSAVLTVGSGDGPVVLEPVATGQAQITVTATDPSNAAATETFTAVVENRPEGEDVPAQQVRSAISAADTVEASFGDTGVEGNFRNVQQSGTVTVGFVPDSSASGDPSLSESFENVSGYRWDVDNEDTTFGSADLAFSLEDADVEGIQDPSRVIVLVAEDRNGTFEPVTTEYDSEQEALIAKDLTGFSTFRMASDSSDNPLPVEMAGFTATATESGALLEWRTASETGNAGFEVQHKGPDATTFGSVGFVEGAGTSTTSQRYQYRLADLKPGPHQFRLQQRDTDGTTSPTDPVTLKVEAERALTFEATGPNPVRQETQLTLTVEKNGPVEVNLYNVLGQQVRQLYSQTATVVERYTVDVDATGLPTGKYFAQLSGPSGTRTQKIVIVR